MLSGELGTKRRTREKKARYTCLKERRDTYSTVTKHSSFGRVQKGIEERVAGEGDGKRKKEK